MVPLNLCKGYLNRAIFKIPVSLTPACDKDFCRVHGLRLKNAESREKYVQSEIYTKCSNLTLMNSSFHHNNYNLIDI